MLMALLTRYFLHRAKRSGMVVGGDLRINGLVHFGTEPFLIRIGRSVELTHGVTFITHDGSTKVVRTLSPSDHMNRYGTIEIKDNCFIGIHAILMPNIVIGPNSIVGAGSVVTRDVPPNSIAAGNPARVIATVEVFSEKVIKETVLQLGHSTAELRDHLWKQHTLTKEYQSNNI